MLFLEKDIHFVAINDGVDSEKGDNDFTPLRNLFNEWYARDTSKKIRAVVKAKGMSGKRLSHLPPYGYIMGEDDKWVIDEETGPVVKEIFALCLSGLGPTKIANILTTRNIPTPGTVNYRRYGNKQGYCPQAPCKWLYQTVSNILERVEYLGHTVNFKTTKKSYKSKKVIINGDDKLILRVPIIKIFQIDGSHYKPPFRCWVNERPKRELVESGTQESRPVVGNKQAFGGRAHGGVACGRTSLPNHSAH